MLYYNSDLHSQYTSHKQMIVTCTARDAIKQIPHKGLNQLQIKCLKNVASPRAHLSCGHYPLPCEMTESEDSFETALALRLLLLPVQKHPLVNAFD